MAYATKCTLCMERTHSVGPLLRGVHVHSVCPLLRSVHSVWSLLRSVYSGPLLRSVHSTFCMVSAKKCTLCMVSAKTLCMTSAKKIYTLYGLG